MLEAVGPNKPLVSETVNYDSILAVLDSLISGLKTNFRCVSFNETTGHSSHFTDTKKNTFLAGISVFVYMHVA